MTTVVIAVAAFHVMALAGVLLLSKYSAVLVDEDFRPLRAEDERTGWREHIVSNHDASMTTSRG